MVFPDEADPEIRREVVSGQIVLPKIPLAEVRTGLEKSIHELAERSAGNFGKIEKKRNVNHHKAVISGTRIAVASVKRLADDGFSIERILKEYPSLRREDVEEALKYKDGDKAA